MTEDMEGLRIARRRIATEAVARTGILDLTHLGLMTLPPELSCLSHIHKFECSLNQVKDLSPLAGLTALQTLVCSDTQVNDLSPLAGLTALQTLYCYRTPVLDLSPLAGLTALHTLSCWVTQVNDLSPLAGLTALRELNCADTEVNDLSPLTGLTALQTLDCGGTRVSDLSPLAGLTALRELNCNRCALSHVPERLINNQYLKYLYLYQASIPGIPLEVFSTSNRDNCIEFLRAYLHALQLGEVEVTDTKLLILGNGLIGKTQIYRRLRGKRYDENVASTHGIVVRPALLPLQDGSQLQRLHLWDFGGQDIYHSTHSLFMRSRSIFLLVWIPQAEKISEYEHEGITFRNQPLNYWLAYIRHLSGLDNPVLVVQTRCDRPEEEVRRLPVAVDALEAFYFCKVLQYSSLKNRGRAALDEALHDAATWLREQQGKIQIGKGWMRVKQRLEAMRDADAAMPQEQRKCRTLSQEDFRQLCADEGGNISSPEYLLNYLHNTGAAFYSKGLFRDQIVLDQGWALEAIYSVFNRAKCYRQLRYSQGRFRRSLLQDLVWQDYSVDDQKLFLDMMQSCGICFMHQRGDEDRGIEHQYIAPDFLPSKAEIRELKQLWETDIPTEMTVFEYEWHHTGLLRSFMSKIGNEAGLNALYWKDGMYVYESTTGSRALIEQETQEGWKGVIRLQTQKGKALALLERLNERLIYEQDLWGVRGWKSTGALTTHPLKSDSIHSGLPEMPPPKLEFIQELTPKPECCISYAWADESEEGRMREVIVDQLCEEAKARGVQVLRDKSDLGLGEELLRFMKRVAHGERVFVVLSDKYLKSFNCMFELTEIWNYSRRDPQEFARRTRLYALPCVNIFDDLVHEEYVAYWESQVARLKPKGHSLAPGRHMKYRRMQSFVFELTEILETIASRRMPRSFAELAQYGLNDICVGS